MGLETATYISELVATNPDGSVDPKSQGDNHIKLIKAAVQNTFPGLAGRAWRTQPKSGAYTVLATDNMSVLACSASLTLDLTAAATLGNGFLFLVAANSGDVTVDPAGAETINGAATFVLPSTEFALVSTDGTTWRAHSLPRAISAFILTLLDDVDAATVRTTIGAQLQDAELDALAALAANGLIARTGAGAVAARTLTAGSSKVTVSNGDGVAGNPTVDAAAATESQAGAVELATQTETDTGTDDTRAITPLKLRSNKFVAGGRTTLSGSTYDVTSIPAWAKRITIYVLAASFDTANDFALTLGDAGGLENVGYGGGVIDHATNISAWANYAQLNIGAATGQTTTIKIVLELEDAATNTWSISGNYFSPGAPAPIGGTFVGYKATSAALDRFRLSRSGGSGNFDAGIVSYTYE